MRKKEAIDANKAFSSFMQKVYPMTLSLGTIRVIANGLERPFRKTVIAMQQELEQRGVDAQHMKVIEMAQEIERLRNVH